MVAGAAVVEEVVAAGEVEVAGETVGAAGGAVGAIDGMGRGCSGAPSSMAARRCSREGGKVSGGGEPCKCANWLQYNEPRDTPTLSCVCRGRVDAECAECRGSGLAPCLKSRAFDLALKDARLISISTELRKTGPRGPGCNDEAECTAEEEAPKERSSTSQINEVSYFRAGERRTVCPEASRFPSPSPRKHPPTYAEGNTAGRGLLACSCAGIECTLTSENVHRTVQHLPVIARRLRSSSSTMRQCSSSPTSVTAGGLGFGRGGAEGVWLKRGEWGRADERKTRGAVRERLGPRV